MLHNRYIYKIFVGSDLLPFYVGIAKEPTKTVRLRREFAHVREAKGGYWTSNTEKNKFILSCIVAGMPFRYEYERNLTIEKAYSREIELIAQYGRRDLGTGCLFNRDSGGRGGRGLLPSTRERLRKLNIGKKLSHETRTKISEAKLGKSNGPRPPKVREKIAAKQRGVPRKSWTKSRRKRQAKTVAANPFHHTEETKARIAQSHLGLKPNEESKAKMSSSQKARTDWKFGEEHHSFKAEATPQALAVRRYRARLRGENVPLISTKGRTAPVVSPGSP